MGDPEYLKNWTPTGWEAKLLSRWNNDKPNLEKEKENDNRIQNIDTIILSRTICVVRLIWYSLIRMLRETRVPDTGRVSTEEQSRTIVQPVSLENVSYLLREITVFFMLYTSVVHRMHERITQSLSIV